VAYFHGDQIATTRHLTDGSADIVRSRVTTAFGEPVYEDGAVGTRYAYAGGWGYESFDALDWGTGELSTPLGFPYLHVGKRWYAPETGRFLERDPIGINGGMNVFAYGRQQPVTTADPSGLIPPKPPYYTEYPFPPRPLTPLTPQEELKRTKIERSIAKGIGGFCIVFGGPVLGPAAAGVLITVEVIEEVWDAIDPFEL
jgi:RHS repeat-associated protein